MGLWVPFPHHVVTGIMLKASLWALGHFLLQEDGSLTHVTDEKSKAQRIWALRRHTVRTQLNRGLSRPFSDSVGNADSKGQFVVGLHPPMLVLLIFMLQLWDFPFLSRVGEAGQHILLVESLVS